MPETGVSGPFIIDTTDYMTWFGPYAYNCPTPGPYRSGSNLYAAWRNQVSGNYLTIFKSTDQGRTWSELMHASDLDYAAFVARAGSTDILRIIQWTDDAGPWGKVILKTFDMSTEALATVGSQNLFGVTERPYATAYNHITGEDFLFTVLQPIAPSTPGEFRMYRGTEGTWGAVQTLGETQIDMGSGSFMCQAVSDGTGAMHVFFVEFSSTSPSQRKIQYIRVAPDGTPDAMQTLMTYGVGDLPTEPSSNHAIARPSVIGDFVILPLTDAGYWLVGTPLSGPSFTLIDSGNSYADGANVSVDNAYNTPGTMGRLWWHQTYSSPAYDRVDVLFSCTFDGTTKGDVETVHDEYNNPSYGDVPPDDQQMMAISPPVQLSSSLWGFTCNLYRDGSYNEGQSYFEWSKAAPAVARGWAVIGRGPASVKLGAGQGYAHCS